jgi:HD-like signal output (HDOD) protein/CheY-like chemotaxis protein
MDDMTHKKRIMFVDDETKVLDGLRRMLRDMRKEWDMTFAANANEALASLKEQPCDIIVSDMRMPGKDGVQLLNEVKDLYPATVRFILSGHADKEMIIRSVGPTHQFLTKPCDSALLKKTVSRAFALREVFQGERLMDLIQDTSSLPTLPELYQQLYDVLNSPKSSMLEVAEVISSDVAMTAKILQLVNSAFFSLPAHIEGVAQAVSLLGIETINSIVLTTSVFDKFDETQAAAFKIHDIYNHSIGVGACAGKIIKHQLQDRKTAEEATFAGMVHDLGKLVMINSENETWREAFKKAQNEKRPLFVLEKEALGITHAEIGAYLLGLWGLSDNIVEAVAFHHEPLRSINPDFGVITAVHLANRFHCLPGSGEAGSVMDSDYIAHLKLEDKLPDFEAVCRNE